MKWKWLHARMWDEVEVANARMWNEVEVVTCKNVG
jgi:hypothetical protein